MAGYNVRGDVLAQGVNAYVYADLVDDTGGGAVLIGFVESWSIRKNMVSIRRRNSTQSGGYSTTGIALAAHPVVE